MSRGDLVEGLMQGLQMTAAGFIVTIYGDVVLPRGGVLWMGSLISLCERVGITETLVRTAVSRLVNADQLKGERVGRRSYYRLAPNAQAEFADVADRLYGPLRDARGWYVLHSPALPADEGRRLHLAKLSGDVWVCPDFGEAPPQADIVMRADVSDPASLKRLAAVWDLPDLTRRYEGFLERFAGLKGAVDTGAPTPAEALVARLLLVHLYRSALLRDPCLPRSALPLDWAGARAHELFIDLYQRLSPYAERAVAQMLFGEDGPLPGQTPETARRIEVLA